MSFRARRSPISLWILGLCLAATVSICGTARCEPETSTVDPELLKLIPEELVYHPKALPDEKNALAPLREAHRQLLPISKFEKELGGELDIRKFRSLSEPLPDEETARQVDLLLEKNRRALELMDEAIARGHLQFPPKRRVRSGDGDNDLASAAASLWGDLHDLRYIRSRRHFEHKQYAQGAAELESALLFGAMLDGSDGALIPRFVGRMCPRVTASRMEAFASRKEVPADVLAGMLVALQRAAPSEEVVVNGVRQDFALLTLPMIADLPKDGDLAKIVAALIDKRRPNSPDAKLLLPKLDAELDALQAGILGLLKDHPEPFDRAETVRLVALSHANEIENLKRPWADQKPGPEARVLEDIAGWPEELSLSILKLIPLYVGRTHDEELSTEKLAKAREQLHKVHNPLGKHLIRDLLFGKQISESAARFRDRGRLEAARCTIAIYVYERKHGARPERLDQLVEAKILPEVPRDPFDGKPLRYSRDRGIIWSVGRDGKDNGGRKPARGEGDALLDLIRPAGAPTLPKPAKVDGESDIVWEIPPTK
jgi:hypothetical protein